MSIIRTLLGERFSTSKTDWLAVHAHEVIVPHSAFVRLERTKAGWGTGHCVAMFVSSQPVMGPLTQGQWCP